MNRKRVRNFIAVLDKGDFEELQITFRSPVPDIITILSK